MTGGPLAGLRVVEMAGIGPGPFAAMMLADLGAEVIRIDRITPGDAGIARPEGLDFTLRGRASIALDLKQPEGVALALDLISGAEALIEGFRPGVMERLGLGPNLCLSRNPRLSYGRLTGWGQEGPLAKTAGHDLTYLAQSGLLSMLGRSGAPPVAPLNLLGDYAGGGMLMVAGLLASVLRARAEGKGQVVDAAMLDGVSLMMVPLCGLIAAGLHDPQARGGATCSTAVRRSMTATSVPAAAIWPSRRSRRGFVRSCCAASALSRRISPMSAAPRTGLRQGRLWRRGSRAGVAPIGRRSLRARMPAPLRS